MPANVEALVAVLLRSSLFLTAAYAVVWVLLRLLKLKSTRIHTIAWFTVLIQGAVLIPIPVSISVAARPSESTTIGVLTPTALTLSNIANNRIIATVVVTCWLAGIVASIAWMWVSYRRFLTGLPGSLPIPEDWASEWEKLQSQSSTRKRAQLHVTHEIGPALCWTPSGYRLLIPCDKWSQLSPEQCQLVMTHELAHLQRGDIWKALCYRLIASLQWFNPLAWLAVHQLAECAEWSCDEHVRTSNNGDSISYVRALLEFSVPAHGVPSLVPTAAGHSLVRRAERLLTPAFMEDARMKKLALVLALALLAILNVVAFKLVGRKKPVQTLQLAADPDPAPPGENLVSYGFVGEPGQEIVQLMMVGDSNHGILVEAKDADQILWNSLGELFQGSSAPPISASSGIHLSGFKGTREIPSFAEVDGTRVIYVRGTSSNGTAIYTPQKSDSHGIDLLAAP